MKTIDMYCEYPFGLVRVAVSFPADDVPTVTAYAGTSVGEAAVLNMILAHCEINGDCANFEIDDSAMFLHGDATVLCRRNAVIRALADMGFLPGLGLK